MGIIIDEVSVSVTSSDGGVLEADMDSDMTRAGKQKGGKELQGLVRKETKFGFTC